MKNKKALFGILAVLVVIVAALLIWQPWKPAVQPTPVEPAPVEETAAPAEEPAAPAEETAVEKKTYDITIWVAEKAVDLTKKQIENFNASNQLGLSFNATVEAVSEADSATQMITDVEAGGDIYCFAQDQFARLVQAGALAKLGARQRQEQLHRPDGWRQPAYAIQSRRKPPPDGPLFARQR